MSYNQQQGGNQQGGGFDVNKMKKIKTLEIPDPDRQGSGIEIRIFGNLLYRLFFI